MMRKNNNKAFVMLYAIAVVGFIMTAMAYVTITFNTRLASSFSLIETADKINARLSVQNALSITTFGQASSSAMAYEVSGRQYQIIINNQSSANYAIRIVRQK